MDRLMLQVFRIGKTFSVSCARNDCAADASHWPPAVTVAMPRPSRDHLGLFDDVLASDGLTNCKGEGKSQAIQQYCRANGLQGYAYIGDSHADLAIWKDAEEVYAVEPSRTLLSQIQSPAEPTRVFGRRQSSAGAFIAGLPPKAVGEESPAVDSLDHGPSTGQLVTSIGRAHWHSCVQSLRVVGLHHQ